jgi:hypothetical protein
LPTTSVAQTLEEATPGRGHHRGAVGTCVSPSAVSNLNKKTTLLVASAVNSEGFCEILGICEDAKEDKAGWPAFLR